VRKLPDRPEMTYDSIGSRGGILTNTWGESIMFKRVMKAGFVLAVAGLMFASTGGTANAWWHRRAVTAYALPSTPVVAAMPVVAAAPVVTASPIVTARPIIFGSPVVTAGYAPVAAPVTTHYAPAPAVAAPVTTYYAPPATTTYYAPSVTAPTFAAPAAVAAPVTSYYAPAPTVVLRPW
jgi:hypothetical protein